MSNVKAALEALKAAMDSPNPELANPYESYSLDQLNEILDEIEAEIEKLPPFAIAKLQTLSDEITLITQAINTIMSRL